MQHPEHSALPSGRSGRLLALALLFASVIIFLLLAVMPAVNLWNSLGDELETLRAQADGYQRLVTRKDEIAKQLIERQAEIAEAADYLAEADPAIAAAQAQRDLGAAAETSGVDVRTTFTLPPATVDGFTSIGFQLSLSGPMRSLRDFLYAIEAGQPRLVVDRLLIRASQSSGTSVTTEVYEMMLDLHGYMSAEEVP